MAKIFGRGFLAKQNDKIILLLKGLSAKLGQSILNNFQQDKLTTCQFISKGEMEKASAVIMEYNKHGIEANKIRLSFLHTKHDPS